MGTHTIPISIFVHAEQVLIIRALFGRSWSCLSRHVLTSVIWKQEHSLDHNLAHSHKYLVISLWQFVFFNLPERMKALYYLTFCFYNSQ